jgi:biofilm PGA synthesis N-glycosyltransferase PgaC
MARLALNGLGSNGVRARQAAPASGPCRVAVLVVFLNEELFLPRLLASVTRQTRLPDRLLLVDDGSDDSSPALARAFAEQNPYAQLVRRERRDRAADRLAAAAELKAFQWAVARLDDRYDVIAKLDGDLEFPPEFFEAVLGAFEASPTLGIAGTDLSVHVGERTIHERSAPWHVRGATKFYRRECLEAISPLPAILGWDTIDEARARMRGWGVQRVPLPGDNPLHMRVTGTYDGAVRGFRRRGVAAWGYGAHPLNVLVSAVVRMGGPPRVVAGLAYLGGWLGAARKRAPRAEADVRRFVQREQRRRMVQRLLHRSAR